MNSLSKQRRDELRSKPACNGGTEKGGSVIIRKTELMALLDAADNADQSALTNLNGASNDARSSVLTPIPIGPELDAAIAVAFFGWQWWLVGEHAGIWPPPPYIQWNLPKGALLLGDSPGDYPKFRDWENALNGDPDRNWMYEEPHCPSMRCSTRMDDAWRVVKEMVSRGWAFSLYYTGGHEMRFSRDGKTYTAEHDSAPAAICYAALAAVAAQRAGDGAEANDAN